MSGDEIELRAQLRALDRELESNKRKRDTARTQKQRAKRRRAESENGFEFSKTTRLMASLLFVVAGYHAGAAVAYVAHVLRRRGHPSRDDEDIRQHVESSFLDCDLEVLMPILDATASTHPRRLARVWSWYTQWQLLHWVKRKNEDHGVAPQTALVLASFDHLRQEAPAAFRPVCRGGPEVIGARVWARRWRLRWGARHANLKTSDDMTVVEKQEKAVYPLAARAPWISNEIH